MMKLTDTQLIVLSKAAQRDDGAGGAPDGKKSAAVAKVGASLLARKLMREIRSKPGMPVWRKDEDDRPMSLVILRAGRDAIRVEDETDPPQDKSGLASKSPLSIGPKVKSTKSSNQTVNAVESREPATGPARSPSTGHPRPGSKQAMLIDMMAKPDGATIDALIKATGWQPHTTRAALTELRKRGYAITRTTRDDRCSCYSISLASFSASAHSTSRSKRA